MKVPNLTGWRFSDSLPEIKAGFDDSSWAVADHVSTNIGVKPLSFDGRVFYGERRVELARELAHQNTSLECDSGLYVDRGNVGRA